MQVEGYAPAMSDEPVLTDVSAGVATLTLNRPDNRNALSAELVNGLGSALREADADPDVRVIVLTNAGPAFCAGADLKGSGPGVTPLFDMPSLFRMIQTSATPVVGRIAGHCVAGGVGLAAACDLSVIDADARFGFTEVRIGVAPAMIAVVCLPKLSRADAQELFLTGARISGARAAEVGLITRAVPADELDAAVDDLVGQVLRGGPTALALTKQVIADLAVVTDVDAAFADMQARSRAQFGTEEAAEGIAAFREKRAPSWVPDGR